MNFKKHSELEGTHAFLSASNYHWLGYCVDKLADVYRNKHIAAKKGAQLHEYAAFCIRLGQKLPRSKKTLNMYVNDAIGFRMTPEQILYFSNNCYGTADAISFRNDFLRIHDLKTGITPASMKQLMIYAALFCLEYSVKPNEIGMELRIYQNDDIAYLNPDSDDIFHIMDKIITFDQVLKELQAEEE